MGDERSEKIAVRRKRLRFRAERRGFKEADLLFGAFAVACLGGWNDSELDQFESLLDVPERDVFDWLQDKQPVPDAYNTVIFTRLKDFCRRQNPQWNV